MSAPTYCLPVTLPITLALSLFQRRGVGGKRREDAAGQAGADIADMQQPLRAECGRHRARGRRPAAAHADPEAAKRCPQVAEYDAAEPAAEVAHPARGGVPFSPGADLWRVWRLGVRHVVADGIAERAIAGRALCSDISVDTGGPDLAGTAAGFRTKRYDERTAAGWRITGWSTRAIPRHQPGRVQPRPEPRVERHGAETGKRYAAVWAGVAG